MAPITSSEKMHSNLASSVSCALLILLFIVGGCTDSPDEPSALSQNPYIALITCTEVLARTDANITCRPIKDNAILVQGDMQHVLQFDGPSVTFNSTILLEADPDTSLVVAVLDGTAVVSSGGISRVVNAGLAVLVPLDDGLSSTFAPFEPEPYDVAQVESAPLNELPRAIAVNTPIPSPTPSTTPSPTEVVPTGCPRPSSWTATHTIQRGDNLTIIANLYDVSINELQQFNCLANPNRITPGDILFVPGEQDEDNTTASPQVLPPAFWVDNNRLLPSNCTMIHWAAEGARLVYFQGEPAAREADNEICPVETTTYTLSVIQTGGEQLDYNITVTVQGTDD